MRPSIACVTIVAALSGRALTAQQATVPADSGYTRTDTLIAARDGTRLFTVILTPRSAAGPLPILMDRTPYGAKGFAT